jgi:hypothetical protein
MSQNQSFIWQKFILRRWPGDNGYSLLNNHYSLIRFSPLLQQICSTSEISLGWDATDSCLVGQFKTQTLQKPCISHKIMFEALPVSWMTRDCWSQLEEHGKRSVVQEESYGLWWLWGGRGSREGLLVTTQWIAVISSTMDSNLPHKPHYARIYKCPEAFNIAKPHN